MGEALFRGVATALVTPFSCGEVDYSAFDALIEKQDKNIIMAMKNFPSVIRYQYTYALLIDKDTKKLFCLASSETSSITVPGVTILTTSLFTIP